MERTERLLDLVTLFLDAKAPVSWAQLKQAFADDYSGPEDSATRKFERDKAELLELGLPLTYSTDEEGKGGYQVDRSAYYLPEAGWSTEELAVLYSAGSAALASGAFPGANELAHALRKIAFFAGPSMPAPRLRLELDTRASPERLDALWAALAAHKDVELTYYSPRLQQTTQRRVSPYGLALRRGIWALVGHCHLRQGIRTFHVHRIRGLTVNAQKPKSADFEVPAAFRLDDYVASWPWEHRFHAPVEVTLKLDPELAKRSANLFPQQARDDGFLMLKVTDLDGLMHYLLSLGSQAKVDGPDEARRRYKEIAARLLEAHRGEP